LQFLPPCSTHAFGARIARRLTQGAYAITRLTSRPAHETSRDTIGVSNLNSDRASYARLAHARALPLPERRVAHSDMGMREPFMHAHSVSCMFIHAPPCVAVSPT